MVISDVKLIFLSEIVQAALGYRVKGKGFPHQNVALVFFVLNNTDHGSFCPCCTTSFGLIADKQKQPDTSLHHCQHRIRDNIAAENIAHNFRFFFVDGDRFVLRVIVVAQAALEADQFAALHLHFQALFDIGRNVFNLLLCHRA